MSELLIIQYLMSGLIPDLRKELARRASSLNTLNEFLKYAKIEYDLYATFEKSRNLSLEPQQPFFFDVNYSLTTMINKPNRDVHRG